MMSRLPRQLGATTTPTAKGTGKGTGTGHLPPGLPEGARNWLATSPFKNMQRFSSNPAIMGAVRGVTNAAKAQLDTCLAEAGVNEANLGLPISVAKMTGDGKFFTTEDLNEATCYTMMQWMMSRINYYSGIKTARKQYNSGTNVGLVVAIVIGSINLTIILGCVVGLFVCIRYRACYFCMKEIAPGCAECLVECGCGPADAERLNNEHVMKSEGVEMRTA